ncbi:MAG TPA: hypothetical protein ENJ95_21690 [Bacteroidetes bacterium]|nr:hypothetical protein [Bacteroidota bacterium]
MKHCTWTYVAGEGRNIPVGLYHSRRKGHLIIYVGKKITTIDFNVLDTKEYTFFIDNELCHIRLERRGDEMFYFFEIDKTADTPMNRARWAMERKFLRQLVAALAVFAVLIAGFSFFINYQKETDLARIDELLAEQSIETVATVTIEPGREKPNISYHFVAQNQAYSSKSTYHTEPLVLLMSGMPLESGDEFIVQYSPTNPEVNRIDFKRPSKRQLATYLKRAAQKHLQLHPDEAPQLVNCMLETAFKIDGIGGLADFYFQDTPAEKNPDHNELSYARLVRGLPFQKKLEKECWQ